MTDLQAIRNDWVGQEFETATFEIDEGRLLDWAIACGETDPRFVDRDHPDFQAHPNFTACLSTGRMLPEDFPKIGSGFGIDGARRWRSTVRSALVTP